MSKLLRLNRQNHSYPAKLSRLHDPPRVLYLRGRVLDSTPSVAVIGSRKCTPYGKQMTERIAGRLAGWGIHIISGLAIGIDSLAHRAALAANGRTTAVLPSGFHHIYPASHRSLARQIIEKDGTLLSEYDPDIRAAPYHFPARNRIIAALADALVVIEAAHKSGTLITVEHALDIGVPVLAVPGPATSAASAGTNRLIQTGAALVTSAEDVLSELGLPLPERNKKTAPRAENEKQALLLQLLADGACTAEQLAAQIGLAAADLNRELTHLELDGSIENMGNNTWVLK